MSYRNLVWAIFRWAAGAGAAGAGAGGGRAAFLKHHSHGIYMEALTVSTGSTEVSGCQ
jgi:hypothetical protein